MKIQDLKGKKITVIGLGLHGGGTSTVKFLAQAGAQVLVTDIKKKEELAPSLKKLKKLKNIKYVLGQHRPEDFVAVDMVIKSPAVSPKSPYLKIARKHKIPIETDISLFLRLVKAKIIGITGTKGKSTTAWLLSRFLKSRFPTILAGNIGTSPLKEFSQISSKTKVVLELSSWQLQDIAFLKKSPQVAVITNIYQDHLDKHKSLQEYLDSKKVIFQFQKPGDILVLNYDNELCRKLAGEAPSKVYFVSHKQNLTEILAQESRFQVGVYLKNDDFYYDLKEKPMAKREHLLLPGEHNLENALLAMAVARLEGVSPNSIRKTLRKIPTLPGRLQFLRKVQGVKYYNDTCATTPEATIAALKTLGNPENPNIILIAGGSDKKLLFKDLAQEINHQVKALVLLKGEATDKIKEELNLINYPGKQEEVSDIKEAVKKAQGLAQVGDIILLSPAAASFNLFQNEFDRGEQFEKAVQELS